MSDKNELMTTGSGFLALADFNMNESMAEELEGLEGGFDRVKIPSGGATMFELPGDEADEPEMVKEFSAVILHHHPVLQYYKEKYTGGSNPPDCAPSISLAPGRTTAKPAKPGAGYSCCGRASCSR